MDFLSTHPFTSLALSFGLVMLVTAWFLFDIHRKWRRIFGRGSPKREEAVADAIRRIGAAEKEISGLQERISPLEAIGRIAVQKVGFLRFNPFEHTGGDQSFAICLLDRDDNGVIISSLYTRDGVRVYAKEVEHAAPQHPLSDEEKKVLAEALGR